MLTYNPHDTFHMYDYLHFTNKETEAQRQIICLRLLMFMNSEMRFNSESLDSSMTMTYLLLHWISSSVK